MTAALAWYPDAAPALEAVWRGVRDALGEGPEALDWSDDHEAQWAARPILTQTCSIPFARRLHRDLHCLGAFDFGLEGAAPGLYRSHLVMRLDDPRGVGVAAAAGVALNGADSQSGWGALHATGLPIGPVTITGAHARSMEAVAAGRAHLAAIDAVTWRLRPHPRLRVRATTPPTPAPPLLTARADLVAPLRRALAAAVAGLPVPSRRASGLRAFVPCDASAYLGMDLPPAPEGSCNRGTDAA